MSIPGVWLKQAGQRQESLRTDRERTDNGKSDFLLNIVFACISDFFVQFFDHF
jgi:hypothetical protein